MYDWVEVRWATDAFWVGLAGSCRRHGIDAPAELDRERPFQELCRDPMLIFGQACGYHYLVELRKSSRW